MQMTGPFPIFRAYAPSDALAQASDPSLCQCPISILTSSDMIPTRTCSVSFPLSIRFLFYILVAACQKAPFENLSTVLFASVPWPRDFPHSAHPFPSTRNRNTRRLNPPIRHFATICHQAILPFYEPHNSFERKCRVQVAIPPIT
jgi:hypothetical protein